MAVGHEHDPRTWIVENDGKCYTTHLKEAIKVNKVRGEVYSKLTNGESRKISEKLIAMDYLGLLFSAKLDTQSKNLFGIHGFPLVCEVIPSMLKVLDNPLMIGKSVSIYDYKKFPATIASREISQAFYKNGLGEAHLVIKKYHQQLKTGLQFNCLARQFIRSMDLAIEINAESPTIKSNELTWNVVKKSLLILPMLSSLDHSAVSMQVKGIPILCAEIPELPQF